MLAVQDGEIFGGGDVMETEGVPEDDIGVQDGFVVADVLRQTACAGILVGRVAGGVKFVAVERGDPKTIFNELGALVILLFEERISVAVRLEQVTGVVAERVLFTRIEGAPDIPVVDFSFGFAAEDLFFRPPDALAGAVEVSIDLEFAQRETVVPPVDIEVQPEIEMMAVEGGDDIGRDQRSEFGIFLRGRIGKFFGADRFESIDAGEADLDPNDASLVENPVDHVIVVADLRDHAHDQFDFGAAFVTRAAW